MSGPAWRPLLALLLLCAAPAMAAEDGGRVIAQSGRWVAAELDGGKGCIMMTGEPKRLFMVVRTPESRDLYLIATGVRARAGRHVRLVFDGGLDFDVPNEPAPAQSRRRGGSGGVVVTLAEEAAQRFNRALASDRTLTLETTSAGGGWRIDLSGTGAVMPAFAQCMARLPAGGGGNGGGGRPRIDPDDEIPPYTYMREPEPTPAPASPARRPAAPGPRPGANLLPLPHPLAPRGGEAAHPDGPEKLPE